MHIDTEYSLSLEKKKEKQKEREKKCSLDRNKAALHSFQPF